MAVKKIDVKKKITVVLFLVFLLFLAVVVKLAYVQFVQGEDLQAKAKIQRTGEVVISAKRGTIYDRNGNTLAVSISTDSVYANPSTVKKSGKAEETAAFLSETLDLDQETVLKRITSDNSFEWVKRKADFEAAQKIEEADLAGIKLVEENQRYYPQNELAANLLGFAGIDNQGLEGLEVSLDDTLRGVDGSIISYYDAKNQEIPQAAQIYNEPLDGYDVVLTLDENIQYFAERELDKVMAWDQPPKSASAIIMDPKTGEILAMATRPTYDPNNYADYEASLRRNPLVNDVYEPGSTFKIITSSVALEEQVVSLTDRFYCPGYQVVGSAKIKCWRSYNPHGSQLFPEVIQNSCNPGFVQVGLRIEEKEKGLFYKYIRAFGYGQKTGIGISGEGTGIMIAEENLKKVNIATIAIGQGIAVTPIQMITAVCAVANDGVLLAPQLIKQVIATDGSIISEAKPQVVRQVVSADTADTVCQLLEGVVAKGTAKRAYIEGFRVGGKTGTAQKVENGVYAKGKYVASFVGMAPADDPQVVCLVIIDEPSGANYQGGQIAAPLFQAIMTDVVNYLGIVPQISLDNVDNNASADSDVKTVVPDLRNLTSAEAEKVLGLYSLEAKISGIGKIVASQTPAALSHVSPGSTVVIKLADKEKSDVVMVPDLTGKSIGMAADILSTMGLKLKSEGSNGTAYEQDPIPGEKAAYGGLVTVKFNDGSKAESVLAP